MKNFGIKIVPIAVGRDVQLDELRKMATNPLDVQFVDFSELSRREDLVLQLLQKFCPIAREWLCVLLIHSTHLTHWHT